MYTTVLLLAGVALVAGSPQGGLARDELGADEQFSLSGQIGSDQFSQGGLGREDPFPQENLGAEDQFTSVQRPRVGSPRPQGGQRAGSIRPSSQSQEFICRDDGVYEDPDQCDKYWVCDGGVATPRICDDGLVFDIYKADVGSADPCESPYVVDCDTRLKLQEATYPSEFCPRANGIYADPNPNICSRFYTCIKGVATPTDCISGLQFDETTGICNWPDKVGRTGCEEDKKTACIKNGAFCCTGEQVLNSQGIALPHPTYINPDDCQKFYVCLNGQTPQESSCSLGQVYNEQTMMCDYPENVKECKGWYENNPLFDVAYDDADGDGLRDFGDRRDFTQTSIN